jgi:CO/xanthine dehydrogenase FAD-binding subunit
MLIDIGAAADREIRLDGDRLIVSALARHADLERSVLVRDTCPMLAEAAALIGNVRVRHRGTIGGSLAHAEATAEWPCVAVALGATIRVLGPDGERAVDAADLVVTHLTTSLATAEVVTRVEVPVRPPRQGTCFVEVSRRAGDFAMVEVAAVVSLTDHDHVADARLVVGATADKPVDVSALTAELRGRLLDRHQAASIGQAVAADAPVGASTHASADYRRAMIAVLVERALITAAGRAQSHDHRDADRAW